MMMARNLMMRRKNRPTQKHQERLVLPVILEL